MNGPLLNDDGAGLDRFTRRGREPSQVIEDLHLAAYARRPTSEESLRLEEYVAAHADPDEAYSGVLWALLNSSEFALNH
jgi:hypothetical protein